MKKKFAPEVLSAWVHHKFTQIHPFQDGNGRVARTLASLVFLKAGLFPLVLREKDRDEYIISLEESDAGDISRLVRLFASRQRSAILSALSISREGQRPKHIEQIIDHTIDKLKSKNILNTKDIDKMHKTADKLKKIVFEKPQDIQNNLLPKLKDIKPYGKNNYNVNTKQATNSDDKSQYFYKQIIDMANQHDYFANIDSYKSWSRLAIATKKVFKLVYSIHGYSHEYRGIMTISGFVFERVKIDKKTTDTTVTKP